MLSKYVLLFLSFFFLGGGGVGGYHLCGGLDRIQSICKPCIQLAKGYTSPNKSETEEENTFLSHLIFSPTLPFSQRCNYINVIQLQFV